MPSVNGYAAFFDVSVFFPNEKRNNDDEEKERRKTRRRRKARQEMLQFLLPFFCGLSLSFFLFSSTFSYLRLNYSLLSFLLQCSMGERDQLRTITLYTSNVFFFHDFRRKQHSLISFFGHLQNKEIRQKLFTVQSPCFLARKSC